MPRKDGARPLDDRNRMTHMLWAAQEALTFAASKTRNDLAQDRLLLRGLVHCIQEIGEAAANVRESARCRAPQLPWTRIVGMRHRIVHVYYDIDADAVWAVVQNDLRPLIAALESALAAWPAPPAALPSQSPPQG